MSLMIKKVSFGNGNAVLAVQRNFWMPASNSKQSITIPQQSNMPLQQPVNTQPLMQPISPAYPAPIIPQTVPPQSVMQPALPAIAQTNPMPSASSEFMSAKSLGYVAAGLALVSLGINGVGAVRNRRAKNLNETLGKIEQQVVTKIEEKINNLSQKTDNAIDGLRNQLGKETDERIGLGKFQDGVIGDIKKQINEVKEMASKNSEVVVVGKASNFLSREVEINGSKMQLATTLHGYGMYTEELEKALKTEATNRMFGLVDRSNIVPSDKITVRVPTAEFKGIAKTGGMADVPREVIANLGAFVNSKQDVRLIVDMPMYLGEVLYKNGEEGLSATFNSLKALGNGRYNWVSSVSGKNGETIIAKNLERIAEVKIPVYDDMTRTMQDVEVYMARGIQQDVDMNLLKNYMNPETLADYNKAIEHYNNVYKKFTDETAQLKATINEKVTPLNNQLKELTSRNNLSDADKALINEIQKQIKEIQKPLNDAKKEFVKSNGNLWKNGLIELVGDADGHMHAKISFDGVFYKNDKFDMKGPRFPGADKNIYDDKVINAGESERFAYFDKYFYEFLLKSHEHTNERLGADLIIGNDWHTGGISAMIRLLTRAKGAVGDISLDKIDRIANIPIVTILHNARLAGATAHSNSKLFNIMFGEHAAEIVENAHMPDVYNTIYNVAKKAGLSDDAAKAKASEIAKEYGLPSKCWNGLMHQNCVNPQTMATAYSDVIVPVSDKYTDEIASLGVYGRENFELFRLRKFVSDNASEFNSQKTIVGVTNGSDRVNNMLTSEGAVFLEKALNLPKGSLRVYKEGDNVLEWHNHNKKVILDRVIADVANPGNPMKLSLREMTDLTGVNENTPIYSTAGRIVDQKGLDIFAEAVEEFLRKNKITDGNYPVFYAQGNGDKHYIAKLLEIKKKVAQSPELGGEAAAKRIVFANLFAEPGRYDACKLMSDFSIMSSWFEPCGLVHKQFASYSGAIPVVNRTGGLTSGLTDGVDAIFAKFKPDDPSKEAVIAENKVNFADAMTRAYEIFTKDKVKLEKMFTKSYKNDFSWLVKDGPMAQYVKMFADLKVIKPQVLESVNVA